jgi:HTH-type transcriptional regulator/antitoxin HigA
VPKPIKNSADHAEALARIGQLMSSDPSPDTPEGQELETWAILVEDYERRRYPQENPDPIEAIRFVMEQRGLTHRDLVPHLGSRGRVSEVLAGKRALTLTMRRALHTGLGIPASILLRADKQEDEGWSDSTLARYPIRAIARRGWLRVPADAARPALFAAMREFLSPLAESPIQALTRRTTTARVTETSNPLALSAWLARIVALARSAPARRRYVRGSVTDQVVGELVRLSRSDDGPQHAAEFLSGYGICLVIARHLPRTRLDGAVFFLEPDAPVIGLTLRYDRLDNFWFTLLHEIGHLVKDFDDGGEAFFDDLDAPQPLDPREVAANLFAQRAFIPPDAWGNSAVRETPSAPCVRDLAQQLGIHSSIVAGRAQREHGNYRVLREFVRVGTVRRLFPESLVD